MQHIRLVRVVKGLSIVAPWHAVFLDDEGVCVVADLHIGMERELESKGIQVPVSTYPMIFRPIEEAIRGTGCGRVVLLGDVKHEFGKPSEEEWFLVKKLIRDLRELGCEPEVVRGNHDNYIISILKRMNVKLHQPSLKFGRFVLTHGHLTVEEKGHVIMGHEHPAISIRDGLGVRHRFKVFLSGKVEGRRMTILPSVSPLAYGSCVNDVPSQELLSPMLKGKDLGGMIPYVLEPGVDLRRFPKLSELRCAGDGIRTREGIRPRA